MTNGKMPEWIKDLLRNNGPLELEVYEDDTIQEIITKACQYSAEKTFELMSRPKNLAKIKCIQDLIKESQDMIDKVGNDYSTSWLEDALKPFKKEGSDGQ